MTHGLGNSVKDWYTLGYVEQLSQHFNLVMYDCRGFGKSDKPHDSKFYQTNFLANDYLAVVA